MADTTVLQEKWRKREETEILHPLRIAMYNLCALNDNLRPPTPSYPPLPYSVSRVYSNPIPPIPSSHPHSKQRSRFFKSDHTRNLSGEAMSQAPQRDLILISVVDIHPKLCLEQLLSIANSSLEAEPVVHERAGPPECYTTLATLRARRKSHLWELA